MRRTAALFLATATAAVGLPMATAAATENGDIPDEVPPMMTSEPEPTPTVEPEPEATEEPVPTEVPAGRDPVSGGVTSTQLAGLGLVAALGVAGAGAAARTRRREV